MCAFSFLNTLKHSCKVYVAPVCHVLIPSFVWDFTLRRNIRIATNLFTWCPKKDEPFKNLVTSVRRQPFMLSLQKVNVSKSGIY